MSNTKPSAASVPPQVQSRPSEFVASQLHMLNDPETAYLLPLAIIAHIDLNAFFAQCEQIRLGKLITDPVVCCQWLSLIAISYAARKYGIGRMDTLKSAQEKCPNLIVGHAAVFKKGESHWQYLNKVPDQGIHKVSLDPYRRELRKIIKILKRECDLVEKASVDECNLDFGRLVYSRLMEQFPQLQDLNPDDPLPPVPSELPESLYWVGEVMPNLKEEQERLELAVQGGVLEHYNVNGDSGSLQEKWNPQIEDWDDIGILIGSQIIYKIRGYVFKELGYTTSGGVASTKSVAKLAGGFIKPDMQTIIRPRLTLHFLQNYELIDFTLMGGKAGELALQKLGVPPDTNSIAYIRDNWDLQSIKKEFPNEELLAEKIYELVWGINYLKLKLRTDVKSMMSRKNFISKYPVNTLGDANDWIRVYLGDLYGRLIELDDENLNLSILQKSGNNKGFIYRPRTVSLQITTSSYSKHSRQTQFTVLKNLEKFKSGLESTGFRLLCELLENTKAAEMNPEIKFRELKPTDPHLKSIKIPQMANMSLVVSNFVKTSDANLIDSYGNNPDPGSTQETLKRLFDEVNKPKEQTPPPEVKPKRVTRSDSYIKKLFLDFEAENLRNKETTPQPEAKETDMLKFKEDKAYVTKMFEEFQSYEQVARASSDSPKRTNKVTQISRPTSKESTPVQEDHLLEELIRNQFCSQCKVAVDDVFEHKDYHVALELSSKLNGTTNDLQRNSPKKENTARQEKPKLKKKEKLAKGQTQLPF